MKFTLHEKNDSFQALIVLGMLLMLCMGACQYALSQIMYREAETNMVEKTVQSRHLIDERIKKYYETLRYVNSVAESQTKSRSELNEYIRKVNPALKDFILIGAVTPQGEMIYGDKAPYDILPVLQQTMRGYEKIQYHCSGIFEHVIVSVPYWRGGRVCGAVYGILNSSAMNSLFYHEDDDSVVFAASQHSWQLGVSSMTIESQQAAHTFFNDESHWNSLSQKLYYNDYGIEAFENGGKKWYMVSVAVPELDGWYVYRMLPAWVVDTPIHNVLYLVLVASMVLAVLFWLAMWTLDSNRRESQDKLIRLAYIDELTGLYNYAGLRRKWHTGGRKPVTIFVVDFNSFSALNMIMGNEYGDIVLKKTAAILKDGIDQGEMVCRVTADRFALLMNGEGALERVQNLLEQVRDSVREYTIVLSAGASVADEGGHMNAAYERAITALKYAKQGSNIVVFYDQKMYEEQQMRKRLEEDFEHALERRELKLYLQAKHHLQSDGWAGSEALVRWHHPELGLILPYQFVPLLESTGDIKRLDLYMLKEACRLIRHWLDEGKVVYPISVNISRAHFASKSLVANICMIADSFRVPRHMLELEITESAFIDDAATMVDRLQELSAAGFRLSVDDFGTGYSSLSMLEQIPADVLKLDRNFVLGWERNHNNSLVANVVRLARDFGMLTVIEGVETEEQAAMARESGCDVVQGWLYAKAEPVADYEKRVYGGGSDE